ncbi:MAG: glycine zipper 2TM domain-containing protein [Rhodoferax sp.]|jgi:outer membrane lipoprotein SlyB|nr:glycine zipper 2TM domain-containing protein [Rhodoferax sp.]
MNILHNYKTVASITSLLFLGACADMNTQPNPTGVVYPQTSSAYTLYGVVQSIDLVPASSGNNIGIGTIAGAVIGGVLGNQVGGGSGNTAATVLGAAGGAYAGHEIEKRNQAQSSANAFKFTIRLSDGSYQAFTQTSNADIRVGDRVQIDNGVVRRY